MWLHHILVILHRTTAVLHLKIRKICPFRTHPLGGSPTIARLHPGRILIILIGCKANPTITCRFHAPADRQFRGGRGLLLLLLDFSSCIGRRVHGTQLFLLCTVRTDTLIKKFRGEKTTQSVGLRALFTQLRFPLQKTRLLFASCCGRAGVCTLKGIYWHF